MERIDKIRILSKLPNSVKELKKLLIEGKISREEYIGLLRIKQ